MEFQGTVMQDGGEKKEGKPTKSPQGEDPRNKWQLEKNNIQITGIPEGQRERQIGPDGIFEQIIAENFPNLGKETGIQVQETERTPPPNQQK